MSQGEQRGSNPRRSEPQSDALPTELCPPYFQCNLLFLNFFINVYLCINPDFKVETCEIPNNKNQITNKFQINPKGLLRSNIQK